MLTKVRRAAAGGLAALVLWVGMAAVPAHAHSSHGVWYPGCHGTQWKAIDGYGNHLAYEYEVPGGTGGHPSWSPRYYWLGYNGYVSANFNGAWWATRRIMDAYAWEGWECGRLAVPTTDPNYKWWNSAVGYVWEQRFTYGFIHYVMATGDVCVYASWNGWQGECGY